MYQMDLRLILIPTTKYIVVGIFCNRTIIKLGFPIVKKSKLLHFSYTSNFFEDFVTKSGTSSFLSNSYSISEN